MILRVASGKIDPASMSPETIMSGKQEEAMALAVADKVAEDKRILTPETVSHFRRHGWVKLEKFFSPADIETLRLASLSSMENPPDLASAYERELGMRIEKRANARHWAKEKQEKVVLDISQDLRLCYPDVNKIILSREAGQKARELLGVDHVRLFQSTYLNKPPESVGNKPTPWHQDSLLPVESREIVNIWVALVDVTPEMGPMKFLSGSHRLGPMSKARFRVLDNPKEALRADDLDVVGDIVSVPLKAGDAVAFYTQTMHAADANFSEENRMAWSIIWMDSENAWTGMPSNSRVDDVGLTLGAPFDHPLFPVIV